MKKNRQKLKKRIWIVPLSVLLILAGCFLIYAEQYYHADAAALSALESDEAVSVSRIDSGWLFDGPSLEDALIFYPGGKVEETAYAPLCRLLAQDGPDVFLVKMPFRLAVLEIDKADALLSEYEYANWYIGGHSLGGAMAADYAAKHAAQLRGVVLLAAYPTKKLADSLLVTTIYGSEDHILNMERFEEAAEYLPEKAMEFVIDGGNHAQFGDYGEQKGDGKAGISALEQQRQTKKLILEIMQDG